MAMKYSKIPVDTFKELQLGAGILCTGFNVATGTITGQLGATNGGVQTSCVPTFMDNADGIDNASTNVLESKEIDYYTCQLSGSFRTINATLLKKLLPAALETTVSGATKIMPSTTINTANFADIWFVGDYSDKHGASNGGFIAICLKNALSTGGFSISTENKGKGTFAATFTAHTSVANPDVVPYEIYIKAGTAESAVTVTYDANTGSGTMTDSNSPYDYGAYVIVKENAFTAPTGKTFVKFNTAANGSGVDYDAGDVFVAETATTLYAIWS